MEVHPGVFVSRRTTDEWEHDPEVGGEMHLLCDEVGIEAGMSRFTGVTEPVKFSVTERETLIVLEGKARIEIAGGPTLELGPGDMASLPGGSETTWYLTTPFKEFWVIRS